jgi:hypothetical protein
MVSCREGSLIGQIYDILSSQYSGQEEAEPQPCIAYLGTSVLALRPFTVFLNCYRV